MAVKLVLFGRQGAGKGTQSALLSEHYGAPHISTGDMLRTAMAEGTDFGRQAQQYVDSGALLPDEIMLGLIASYSSLYIGDRWVDVVIFSILVIVLVFRPTGLLGENSVARA